MSRKSAALFTHYLGILFGILFVAFLGLALWYAVAGPQSEEISIIAYAFYSLTIGASFQLISYLTSKNIPNSIETSQKQDQKYRLVSFVFLLVIILSGILFTYQTTVSTTSSTLPVNPNSSPISARVYFTKILPEPLNETIVFFGVIANGSESPYTYTAKWSDNFSQTNDYGTFWRNFTQEEEIPLSATVVVTSANNKSVTVQVTIAPAITTSFTTNTEGASSVEFLETGLPALETWSVELNQTVKSSRNDSITFFDIKQGNYNFTVSYQYDGNFDSVFNFTPRMGLLTINETSYIQRVNFSMISPDQLLTPSSAPAFSSENGSNFLMVSYLSHLPVSINATVVAAINSSSGQMAGIPTTEVIVKPDSSAQSSLYLTTLGPGTYYATIYVISNGEIISPKSSLAFSIPST